MLPLPMKPRFDVLAGDKDIVVVIYMLSYAYPCLVAFVVMSVD